MGITGQQARSEGHGTLPWAPQRSPQVGCVGQNTRNLPGTAEDPGLEEGKIQSKTSPCWQGEQEREPQALPSTRSKSR